MPTGSRTASMPSDTPTIDDVRAAVRQLAPFASRTPFVKSAWLSELAGADVRLKLEMVQETGSFKIRGAANAIARLKARRPDVTHIVTASAGNHGQAIALTARHAGLQVRVYVPASAPAAKRDSLRRLGADVVETPTYEDAEHEALAAARQDEGVYVPPYNDPDVIAGAGTAALEMLEDVQDLDTLVVPLGGGGLLAGSAIVAKAHRRPVTVIGVEAEASPVFTSALAAGRIVTVEVKPTLADGLAGNLEPGSRTFEIVRALTDEVIAMNETSIARSMQGLVNFDRLVVEGAGAVGVAAILESNHLKQRLASQRVGVILSGRNIDAAVLSRVLSGISEVR